MHLMDDYIQSILRGQVLRASGSTTEIISYLNWSALCSEFIFDSANRIGENALAIYTKEKVGSVKQR